MGVVGVGVAAFGAGVGGHLQHPAECDELSAGVADGRSRDFRASCGGAGGDLVGAEVDDVHAVEYLGDHPALGGYPPAACVEAVRQVAHGGSLGVPRWMTGGE